MNINIRQPAGRWTLFTLILAAVSILGLAGAWLYADAVVSSWTAAKRSVPAESCPTPNAAYTKKERKTMTTAVEKSMIPLIDRTLPAKTETATFGLG